MDCIGIVAICASIFKTDVSMLKGFGLLHHTKDVFGQAEFEKEQLSNIYQVSIYFCTKEGSCKAVRCKLKAKEKERKRKIRHAAVTP